MSCGIIIIRKILFPTIIHPIFHLQSSPALHKTRLRSSSVSYPSSLWQEASGLHLTTLDNPTDTTQHS